MIEISHLVKKYGDHYAVKDLNVRIEEGQIYGFLLTKRSRKIDHHEYDYRISGTDCRNRKGGRL